MLCDASTGTRYRRSEPTQYGLVPTRGNAWRRAAAVFLGNALRIAAHLAARTTAVATALYVTLSSSAPSSAVPWLVPAWLAVEFVAFNLARWLEADSWWLYQRGADGFVFSALLNLGHYIVRQHFAEHCFRLNALRCTATARMLIPAECSAVP